MRIYVIPKYYTSKDVISDVEFLIINILSRAQ
jgi:hypothetical protein